MAKQEPKKTPRSSGTIQAEIDKGKASLVVLKKELKEALQRESMEDLNTLLATALKAGKKAAVKDMLIKINNDPNTPDDNPSQNPGNVEGNNIPAAPVASVVFPSENQTELTHENPVTTSTELPAYSLPGISDFAGNIAPDVIEENHG